MMSQPARRVRKLRLTAPDEASVRRGALLLEDALNTASLPGVDRGRLVIIRRFSVGKILSGQSPASLALTIEQRLFQLGSAAIHAEDPSAGFQSVVFFNDDAEPYICLALKLSRRQNAAEWFWPLAVPRWRPSMPMDDALRNLLFGVMETSAGIWAAVTMMGELQKAGVIESLLSSLREQDGSQLLQAFGLSKPLSNAQIIEHGSNRGPALNESWTDVIARRVTRWGADDARSLWLAAVALVTDNPCRLLNRRLMEQAQQVIRLAVARSSEASSAEKKYAGGEQVETAPAHDSQRLRAKQPAEQEARISRIAASSFAPVLARGASVGCEELKLEDQAIDHQPEVESAASLQPEAAHPTAYAGLYFLLQVMSRLGVAKMLEMNPLLIEWNFPHRLLRYAAERLDVHASDPVLSPLTVAPLTEENSRCDFVAPRSWIQGLLTGEPLIVRKMGSDTEARALFDSSGRVALALWRGRAHDDVRSLIGSSRVKRGPIVAARNDLVLLLDAWFIAMRRWSRRYARMGLVDLIRRPGRICVTRTHVDIFFRLEQADIRVRKAGLDANPRWLPWFGRVVQFHYLNTEASDGG